MTTQQQDRQQADQEDQRRQRRVAAIKLHVIRTLGPPADLLGVQVRALWGDYYRVNVLVGLTAASARVAHSYFLAADGNGTVTTATPTIRKTYEPPVGVAAR